MINPDPEYQGLTKTMTEAELEKVHSIIKNKKNSIKVIHENNTSEPIKKFKILKKLYLF